MINCPQCGSLNRNLDPYGLCQWCVTGLVKGVTLKGGMRPDIVMTTAGPMTFGWIVQEVEVRRPPQDEVSEAMGNAGA